MSEQPVPVINMHDAKTHLSRLVTRAAAGEPFIIAKAGKPMVRVVPITDSDSPTPQRLGFLAGQIDTPEDFDTMAQSSITSIFETA